MPTAQWFTQHEHGGFPIERAALWSCDLSIPHVGGEWQWLFRQAGRDVAEGVARTASANAVKLYPDSTFARPHLGFGPP